MSFRCEKRDQAQRGERATPWKAGATRGYASPGGIPLSAALVTDQEEPGVPQRRDPFGTALGAPHSEPV